MHLLLGMIYVLIIGAVIVSMAVLLLMGRKETYNKMYLGCQAMVITWCLSQILILLSVTQEELLVAYGVGNLGVCFVGVFWFGFALLYGKQNHPARILLPSFVLSGVHYLLVLTNPWHHLYYFIFNENEIVYGLFFYTNVVETYMFVMAGAVLLYRALQRENATEHHIQTKTEADTAKKFIILAVLIPIGLNVCYVTGWIHTSFDITPLGFGISGILLLLATFRYRFMEINMEAFDVVLSGLSDGVAIFDQTGRRTFFNAAFAEYMGKGELDQAEKVRLQIVEMSQIQDSGLQDFVDLSMQQGGKDISGEDMQLQDGEDFWEGDMQTNASEEICGEDMKVQEKNQSGKNTQIFLDSQGRYLQVQVYQNMTEVSLEGIVSEQAVVFVLKDISRYFALLQQSRELAVTNERLAMERERNRIAGQVHDTAGHTLTMIQSYLKLAMIAGDKQEAEEVQKYLEEARELSRHGIQTLRESINQMRKESTSELVTQGILQLADQVKEIPVEVTIQGEDSEQYSSLSRVLYDCVRESITNTLKYADASKMEIVLRFQGSMVELMIADDGVGCEAIQDHNGLLGIRERVGDAGGSVKFMTGKNEGFLTLIRLPAIDNAESSKGIVL